MRTPDTTELVLGSGEVFFDPFTPGTLVGEGERYIGNTPRFRTQREIERRRTYTSYRGLKRETKDHIVSQEHTIDFITDSLHIDNVGMWWGQEEAGTYVEGGGEQVTEFIKVKHGRFYRLGKSMRPHGVNHVSELFVYLDSVAVPAAGNWQMDGETGRIYVETGAPDIPDGSEIEVRFQYLQHTAREISPAPTPLVGALRYVSKAVYGVRQNMYFPMVRIVPNGQVDHKSNEWKQLGFTATVLKLNAETEELYIEQTVEVGLSYPRQVLADENTTEAEFIALDDDLEILMNIEIRDDIDYGLTPIERVIQDEGTEVPDFPAAENELDEAVNSLGSI